MEGPGKARGEERRRGRKEEKRYRCVVPFSGLGLVFLSSIPLAARSYPLQQLDPSLPNDVRELAESVRAYLVSSFPEMEERLYAGARSAGYRTEAGGTLMGLFVREGAVHLVFTRGAELPDAAGLLRGGGSTVKWLTLRPGDVLPREELYALVVAAMLVGAGGRH
jgi:hypothetical protein